ncbi:MAG TPA: phosphogluconate dehydrogenase C-terminal domain-containing protein [Pseudolysinimonas sp.]|nr:phosphogluconate dehydrogenase C-terminal domain-containing protein [Pseudolysinimonas sp.]
MTKVALLGAGGNMGTRISSSLAGNGDYELRCIETSGHGVERLRERGLEVWDRATALAGTDVLVFAVPDKAVAQVAAEYVPALDPGTAILFLDPAAIAADRIPRRDDVHCYVTHPTHPPLYGLLAETDADARRDFWGGGLAHQSVVFATAWGDSGVTADRVERLVCDMFAPIDRSHRITVEQMAVLEPALTETLTNGCVAIIHEGMQKVIAMGIPEPAVRDFLMGHLQIGIAIIFGELDWRLSEGARLALEQSRAQIFRDDWDRIFEPEEILASVRRITGG